MKMSDDQRKDRALAAKKHWREKAQAAIALVTALGFIYQDNQWRLPNDETPG